MEKVKKPISLLWLLLLGILVALLLLFSRLRKPVRRYEGLHSVSWIYDHWTRDRMLEHYWGGHLHAGHYGDPPAKKDFISAKNDMIDELLRWGLAIAPPELLHRLESADIGLATGPVQVLDVGCGIGGTVRRLAGRWPQSAEVTGLTLSPAQAARGAEMTRAAGLENTAYLVCDALYNAFPAETFDIVWILETEPHIPDKVRFIQEMVRLLKPGGLLLMGTWNVRDTRHDPLTNAERDAVQFLLDEWNHASFSSIHECNELFKLADLNEVSVADWTRQTVPTWRDALIEPFRHPGVMLRSRVERFESIWRDGFTLLRYDRAFRNRLMQYGVFRGRKVGPTQPQSR